MPKSRIDLVEDDESIRNLVVYALRSSGFDSYGYDCSERFFEALAGNGETKGLPDLVLLDIMLPGENGLSILQRLRDAPSTREIPVIILTARCSEFDKVTGLDAGADDYVTKPFGVMELLSRVKAVLRRSQKNTGKDDLLCCEGIVLDVERRAVTVDGEPVILTYKEFELLAFLMRNAGIVLTRERIMEVVWGFDFEGESRTVDMHIKTLRHKLLSGGALIETVRGVGYRIRS